MFQVQLLPFVLLIFCGLSVFYFEWYFPIYSRVTGQREIQGTITSISYQETFGTQFTIKTKKIEDLPFTSVKLLVTLEADDAISGLSVNDEVVILGEIEELKSAIFGFDEKQYYANNILFCESHYLSIKCSFNRHMVYVINNFCRILWTCFRFSCSVANSNSRATKLRVAVVEWVLAR